MIDLTCPCGRVHRGVRLLPLRCRCGHVTRVASDLPDAPPPRPRRSAQRVEHVAPLPAACVHRGHAIGQAQCNCRSAPVVYACELHTYAMLRRVEHAPAGVAMLAGGRTRFVRPRWCEMCPDHRGALP